jgi:tetratricopeptide (TPR) repeat protein
VLAARFDLARALPRPVMVLGLAKDSRHAARELRVFRSGLSLVPYLESAHSSPLIGDLDSPGTMLERTKRRGTELGVPLLLQLTLEQRDARWWASSELVEVSSGHSRIASSGSSETPEAALSEALQQLDRQYRSGLHSTAFQRDLGIVAHLQPAPREGIVVDAFRLVRRGDRDLAQLKLRNVGTAGTSALQAKIRSERRQLAALDLAPLAPGSTLDQEVLLEALSRDSWLGLSVQVDYQIGDECRRAVGQVLSAAGAAPTETSLEDEMPATYRELTTTAVNYYTAGEWVEARRLLRRVHAAAPNARVARALGLVEWDLRNVDSARKYLTEALESQRRALSPEQRDEVMALLQRASSTHVTAR